MKFKYKTTQFEAKGQRQFISQEELDAILAKYKPKQIDQYDENGKQIKVYEARTANG